jgi:hypothetical protein
VIWKRVAISFEMFGTHPFIKWQKNPEMGSEFSAVFFGFEKLTLAPNWLTDWRFLRLRGESTLIYNKVNQSTPWSGFSRTVSPSGLLLLSRE